MVKVTSQNRKRLESRYGIDIPPDVEYIVPPDIVADEDSDFWDMAKVLGNYPHKTITYDGGIDDL